jgi:hypothetical protein
MNAGYLGCFWRLHYVTMRVIIVEWHGARKGIGDEPAVDISFQHKELRKITNSWSMNRTTIECTNAPVVQK